jgi:cellulose synthase/poly-beta-1,6-N-acetylglucosamine synthase-like glycosyltransferase
MTATAWAIALEALLWGSLAAIAWAYAGYPLSMALLARLRPRPVTKAPIEPTVTLVIAAYNEEKHIADKLRNALALDYPSTHLEILVASDCSTDATHAIVRSFAPAVTLVELPERGGKTAGQNLASAHATGEILVFTDATTEFAPETIRDLVAPFADPSVGCVGAELEYVSEAGTAVGRGAGAYWRYERKLKQLEAEANSLIGVSGCLYAVRRSAYRPIDPSLISDFVIAGEVFTQGYRTVYARGAVSREVTNESTEQEFAMRVRVIVRSINALVKRRGLLNPVRHGWFAYQLLCHKVMRYAVPWWLLVALVSHVALAAAGVRPWLYLPLLGAHLGVYALAALGWWTMRGGPKVPFVHIPFYFLHANAAAAVAALRYLRGERMVTWNPVRE